MSETTGNDTKSYTYDASGNLTDRNGNTFTYDVLNRLISAEAGGATYTYTYDHTGLRTLKSGNGAYEKYINHAQSVVLVLDSSNNVTAKYFRGINLIAELTGSTYYLYNSHGDVVQLIASDGTILRDYEYDAFGIQKDEQALDNNPFRYCGEFFDKETGLIYLRARYYDAEIGRFISEDTHWSVANMIYGDNPDKDNPQPNALAIIQSANLYNYCSNNPVLFVDADGNMFMLVTAAFGAVAGAVVGGVIAANTGGNVWAGIGIGAAAGGLIGLGAGAAAGVVLGGSATATTGAVWAGITGTSAAAAAGGAGAGYESFKKLKDAIGSAGQGFQWHHIVEQCQQVKSGFDSFMINNTQNIFRISTEMHNKITAYYNSKLDFTDGLKVRDWLAGQSFEFQYQFGLDVLKNFGVIK